MSQETTACRFYKTWKYALLALLACLTTSMATSVRAQITSPPTINGTYPTGTNNLAGTTNGTSNTGTLTNLGLNQGVTFDFSGSLAGTGRWNGGLRFNSTTELQVQPSRTNNTTNTATYEFNFSDTVYGFQFTKDGLDNGDDTVVTFYNNGSQVLVPSGVIIATGDNVTASVVGGVIQAEGPGNDNGEEFFTVHLPLTLGIDRVVFSPTNKNNGNTGNVTLQYRDFAWDVFEADMSPDISGLPATATVGAAYSGTVTCNNSGPDLAADATCVVTGLPAGVSVTGCLPNPPVNVASGASITCTVAGTPTAAAAGSNTVTATAGADNDTNGGTGTGGNNQVTQAVFVQAPSIETTKYGSVTTNSGNNDSITDAGDLVIYAITIQNTGNVNLTSVDVATDTLTRIGGGGLTLTSGPSWVSNSGTSVQGDLAPGEVATFSATYVLVLADIESGGVSNTATGTGTPPSGAAVTDISDDGIDSDSNIVDDPTVSNIAPSPILTITKTADDDTLRAVGDIITYTYVVTNTGNVTINNVNINDVHNGTGPAPAPSDETLTTDSAPTGDSTDTIVNNGAWSSLKPGDAVTFTGTYTVTQNDVDTLQ